MAAAMKRRVLEALPTGQDPADEYKLMESCASRFYFVDRTTFEKFRDFVLLECPKNVVEVIAPESENQIATLKSDEKVVYRERLFYNQYSWKVKLGGFKTAHEVESFKDWAATFFADQNDAERVKVSLSYAGIILYCKVEDDVVMTKLTYSQNVRTITHAILAAPKPNNNNNKGTTHASNSLPSSS